MLLENYVSIVRNQYEASFSTLNRCLDRCESTKWEMKVANLTFSQAAFHALFYADFYLHPTHDDSLKEQEFHRIHQDKFRDYEERLDRPQQYFYEKEFVEAYLQHCRQKMYSVLENATESWLLEPSPFDWIPSTRSEVHIYNIRHIQHHAAQLILSLRLDGPIEFPWFRSGWTD